MSFNFGKRKISSTFFCFLIKKKISKNRSTIAEESFVENKNFKEKGIFVCRVRLFYKKKKKIFFHLNRSGYVKKNFLLLLLPQSFSPVGINNNWKMWKNSSLYPFPSFLQPPNLSPRPSYRFLRKKIHNTNIEFFNSREFS